MFTKCMYVHLLIVYYFQNWIAMVELVAVATLVAVVCMATVAHVYFKNISDKAENV